VRLIFLDIDGVLNNETTKEKFHLYTGVNRNLLKLFLDWVPPDVQLILSSTWRLREDAIEHLNDCGLSFFDFTPKHGHSRGHEIEESLRFHKPSSYVILDDLHAGNFLPEQRDRLVQTSFVHGLRIKNIAKMQRILDRPVP
jgi:hypothetical protein